jgi:SAM-dependent methyltransferase
MTDIDDADILDATCGGRSIWHPENKDRDDTLYVDRREEPPGFTTDGYDGHYESYSVDPDEVQDFRDLPYDDDTFNLVVFDPPHVVKDGGMKALAGAVQRKYGALEAETWQSDLRAGFEELWRVLTPGGTLAFKFADNAADWDEVLELAPTDPLFGTTNTKRTGVETRWFLFYKPEVADD